MAVSLSAYAPAAFCPPGIFLVLVSVRGWVDPRAIARLEGLGQLKKSNIIGARTRDLPACGIVPQPTTPPPLHRVKQFVSPRVNTVWLSFNFLVVSTTIIPRHGHIHGAFFKSSTACLLRKLSDLYGYRLQSTTAQKRSVDISGGLRFKKVNFIK
jgi:hypothetical protein